RGVASFYALGLVLGGGRASDASAAPSANGAGEFGYVSTDPTKYDASLTAEASFDGQRSVKECFCGESRHKSIWLHFYSRLHRELSADPSFSGEW
ncbi:unnamed protein product, partial [Polarella glacialis]